MSAHAQKPKDSPLVHRSVPGDNCFVLVSLKADPQLVKPYIQVLYRTPPGSHPEVGHDDCVISDFGLAAYVDPNGGRLYTVAGSAGYSAPEMYPPEGIENGQGRGNGYGLKADMWSLGVIGELLLLSERSYPVMLPDLPADQPIPHDRY